MTQTINLDQGWSFRRLRGEGSPETSWMEVALPHSPFISDLDGNHHWLGECEYRRVLMPPPLADGMRCVLFIGAAMHTARVFVDQGEIARHEGGYLPFEVDLTEVLSGAANREITLRLDNRDNPDVPPGKPFNELDFCWYGGLYRGVELRLRPSLHITDPVAANVTAGGGAFIRTLAASETRAIVSVKTHVRNAGPLARPVCVQVVLLCGGTAVASARSEVVLVAANASMHVEQEFTLEHPRLWSPDSPLLHEARIALLAPDGAELDERRERFGVRRLAFSRSGGFVVNGRRLRLRGTNRHQEMPRVGYAAPRAAQIRDARRIKDAGFDYVRLSHYPQSPDFLDACDELGIVVMNCIPGWQFLGGEKFQDACCQAAHDLVRRDRNHPCVALWELSLNETPMGEPLMARLHAIGHEEYPGDQMFTCGWMDRYDVFVQSRQHGLIHRWTNSDKTLVISEYGDWEFYATNAGFDQNTGAGVFDRWSNSRQFRGSGERGLRQQVFNHMQTLNDILASPAVLGGLWTMFDYARGYDPVRAATGVMDVFRLPKFSYHFYRSQRDPKQAGAGWSGGPAVFIASYWTPASDLRVPVFSNCEEVELRLNGARIARRRPAKAAPTQHLPHPPFVFDLPRFTAGTLEAIGYLGGLPKASHLVATPGAVSRVELVVDDLATFAADTEADVLFAHAQLRDARGSLCIDESPTVNFVIGAGAELLGSPTVEAEAGIASVVVRLPHGSPGFRLHAKAPSLRNVPAVELLWRRGNGVAIEAPRNDFVLMPQAPGP